MICWRSMRGTSLWTACPSSCASTAVISSSLIFSISVSYNTTSRVFPSPLKKAFNLVERREASITEMADTRKPTLAARDSMRSRSVPSGRGVSLLKIFTKTLFRLNITAITREAAAHASRMKSHRRSANTR